MLAAFALLNRAFEILAEGWQGGPDAAVRAGIARDLARAIGTRRHDRRPVGRPADDGPGDRLPDPRVHPQPQDGRPLHGLGRARGDGGSRAAGEVAAVVAYAKNLGLAFQIVDDLIDATGGEETGKDIGKDRDRRPSCGSAWARASSRAADRAATALQPFGPPAEPYARARPLRRDARRSTP